MQCLSSPTRSEIDKAHGQGVWLDVGVPSVRNLRRLSTTRIVLWWLLAVSSVPLHLLYNSAVFSSQCTRWYSVFLTSSNFDGAMLNLAAPGATQNYTYPTSPDTTNAVQKYQKNQTALEKLENEACLKVYTAPIISRYSDVFLVTTYSNSTNSLLFWAVSKDLNLIIDGSSSAIKACLPSFSYGCDLPVHTFANPQNWSIGDQQVFSPINGEGYTATETVSIPDGTRLQYCLSNPVEEHCKLQFSLAIMVIVIISNVVKTVCMSVIAWKQDPEPLVTLGDAIASFLDRPDMTTAGNCIVEKTRFEESRSWSWHTSRWDARRLRWFRAASPRRWVICNIL